MNGHGDLHGILSCGKSGCNEIQICIILTALQSCRTESYNITL
jgi:hypothetical protein